MFDQTGGSSQAEAGHRGERNGAGLGGLDEQLADVVGGGAPLRFRVAHQDLGLAPIGEPVVFIGVAPLEGVVDLGRDVVRSEAHLGGSARVYLDLPVGVT